MKTLNITHILKAVKENNNKLTVAVIKMENSKGLYAAQIKDTNGNWTLITKGTDAKETLDILIVNGLAKRPENYKLNGAR